MSQYPQSGKQWYTLQVLSNQEGQVERRMKRQIVTENWGDVIHEVLVPTEVVEENRNGKRMKLTRKLFPGYVFVNMDLYDEEGKLNNAAWYFILGTDGVISFAGGSDNPLPMPEKEVESLHNQIAESKENVRAKVTFSVGDKVLVTDGAFTGQEGEVQEVDAANGTLLVALSIFGGRPTPVGVKFYQVEKPEE